MTRILLFGACALALDRASAVTLDDISSLIEQHIGSSHVALRSIMSRMSARSSSDPDMNEVLTELNEELEREVEARIKSDHRGAQEAIDESVKQVSDATDQLVSKKETVEKKRTDWLTCVPKERDILIQVEETEATIEATTLELNEWCNLQDKLSVISVAPVKPLPDFSCEFSSQEACASNLNTYSTLTTEMLGAVNVDRKMAEKSYQNAATQCSSAQNALFAAQQQLSELRGRYTEQRKDCSSLSPQYVMCTWDDLYEDKCSKVAEYQKQLIEVSTENGGDLSHIDRKNEWRVTQMAKCIVTKLAEGSDIDDNTLKICEEGVDFDRDVGKLDTKEAIVSGLLSSEHVTCKEETITFAGGNWIVPGGDSGDDFTSKNYIFVDDFSPSIPLPFCS